MFLSICFSLSLYQLLFHSVNHIPLSPPLDSQDSWIPTCLTSSTRHSHHQSFTPGLKPTFFTNCCHHRLFSFQINLDYYHFFWDILALVFVFQFLHPLLFCLQDRVGRWRKRGWGQGKGKFCNHWWVCLFTHLSQKPHETTCLNFTKFLCIWILLCYNLP